MSLSGIARRAGLVAAALFLIVGAGAASAGPQSSANGNGNVFGTSETFSFSTRGELFSAEGHVHVVSPNTDPNTQYRGRVNCALYTLNGVTLSGTITDVSPAFTLPQFMPTNFIAYAEDNGEPGEFRDRWNFFAFVPTQTFNPTCLTSPPFGSVITDGNIDIDPVVP